MRILLLSSVEHHSGSAIRFRGLAAALARRGHDVHLVEPSPAGRSVETPPGVRRHPCPRFAGPPVGQAPLWLLCGALAVLRVRPHVVWALKALPNVWIPARLAWMSGARVAVDVDDLDAQYAGPGFARFLLERTFDDAVRSADDVTVHNAALEQLVKERRGAGRRGAADRSGEREGRGRGGAAPVFVEQGIDVDRFAAARGRRDHPETAALRRALELGPGPVLLYAGHLGPAANLAPLLPALAAVASRHPTARLLVIGGGRDLRSLRSLAASALPEGFARFAGIVEHRDAPNYFALADVALNFLEANEANRHRSSIKVREALAAGVPVVTSRTPDTERFASFVRLVDPGPPEAFVEAVLEELEAPGRAGAAAGAEWLRNPGTFAGAVEAIAARWEEEAAA